MISTSIHQAENLNLQAEAGNRLSLDYIRNLKKQLGQIEQHIVENEPPVCEPLAPFEMDSIASGTGKANNFGNSEDQKTSKK